MKTPTVTLHKTSISKDAWEMKAGDVFNHPELGQMMFQRMKVKRMSAYCFSDGKSYGVHAGFDRKFIVIGTAEMPASKSEYELLRKSPKGTLFVIKTGTRDAAELYSLKGFTQSGKVEGVSPFTGGSVTITKDFTFLLVSSIQK
jgi:hypothetical protein